MTDVKDGKLSDITPDANNANLGTQRGLGMLESSLRKHGAGRSILLDRKGRVIAGNKTVEQAGQIGLDELIIVKTDGTQLVAVQREDLDLADDSTGARELAYADNRVSELDLSWNPGTILADLNSGVDLSGLFREDELSEILGELGKDEEQTPVEPAIDRAEELQQEYGTELGQLWIMDDHRLLIGDCRNPDDVARLVGDKKVNGIFTSPPYAEQRKKQYGGVPTGEYVEWWEAVQNNMRGVLAEDGSFFVNIKPHCEDGQRVLYVVDLVLAMARRWGWRFVDELCWQFVSPPGQWPNRFKNGFEPVYHFSFNGNIKFNPWPVAHQSDEATIKSTGGGLQNYYDPNGKNMLIGGPGKALPTNVIKVNIGEVNTGTLNQVATFPVRLPTFFIKAYSDPGDIWLDPFAGSGTVIMACHNEDRIGYGMEILPKYGAVILHRWEQATNQKAKLTNA